MRLPLSFILAALSLRTGLQSFKTPWELVLRMIKDAIRETKAT
jgi:hypothetical protein